MTLDQFQEQLNTTEQRLMNLTPILTEIGNQMTAELRLRAPVFKGEGGGRLQNSISLEVQPTQFSIRMLDYGAYQNYGVKVSSKGTAKYNELIPSPFNDDKIYEFGTGSASRGGQPWGAYYTGLGPHVGWFDNKGGLKDLTQEVTTRLQTAINNMIQ